MKRKFKLITAVASLSLAIIFLGMGIYAAATDRQIGVTGTITITAERVAATVIVQQRYGTTGNYNAIGAPIQYQLTGEANQARGTKQLGDNGAIALSETVVVYSFQIVITNDFAAAVKIGVNPKTVSVGENNSYLTISQDVKLGESTPTLTNGMYEVPAEQVLTMTYTYTVNPANLPSPIPQQQISVELELKRL
ncbi:MAG: hypothetical protein ACOX6H_02725 [Christensenellales bacterium]|jgi:hypothetical protein